MSQLPTQSHHLILLHGAWAGGWVWDEVTPLLEARGYTVHVVELPGNGHHQGDTKDLGAKDVSLDLYIEYVYQRYLEPLLKMPDRPNISLVAHSGAGILALQLAEKFNTDENSKIISSLIIVAGMMLPTGMTFPQLVNDVMGKEDVLAPHLQFTADGSSSTVPVEAAVRYFFQDLDKEAAEAAAKRLTAQPTGGLAISTTLDDTSGGARKTKKLYIECKNDRSVLLPYQKKMEEYFQGNNLTVVSMDTGHAPQCSQPSAFCDLVTNYLKELK